MTVETTVPADLDTVLRGIADVAVAVSGGVDSLSLAAAAHGALGVRAKMFHAVSPAVPAEATERTLAIATARGWELDLFDAGEFADPDYRANPVNRCFFCKTNLYGAVAARTDLQIVSGTNMDDLGDYRPGLAAAADHGVRHPFVEAGLGKSAVRRLAAALGLGAVADLPASPCLSSRVETGIRIEAPVLAAVHAAERLVAEALPARTVRCRIRRRGVVIELDPDGLARLDATREASLRGALAGVLERVGLGASLAFAPYRLGSAFLRSSS